MKLLLLGDICPIGANCEYFDKMDVDVLFTDIQPIFKNNDYVIANLEVAITEHDVGIEKYGPCLKAPLNTAKTLKNVGITHCSLSNNHTFDFGKKGLADTIAAIKDAGLEYTGIGENYQDSRKNLVLEKDGKTVCVIAVCEHEYSYALDDRVGARPYDVFDTPADIREAKSKYDKVVVIYHGGKELCRYPSPRLIRVCRNMAECGADVVLCQHSHCVGCYEEYNDCHILYGQGNFHFAENLVEMPCWITGLAVTYDSNSDKIGFIFSKMNGKGGIELVKGDELIEEEKNFAERNKLLANGGWREKWSEFCQEISPDYIERLKEPFETENGWKSYSYVGHYLDCEAHHDVLAELFPTANSTNER